MTQNVHPYMILPHSIRMWALKHVTPVPTQNCDLAVRLDDDGYKMLYRPEFINFLAQKNSQAWYSAIIHELLHVLRGDCLISSKPEIDSDLWNYAADVWINHQLDWQPLDQCCREFWGEQNEGIWTYDKLRTMLSDEQLPDDQIPPTRIIHDMLKRRRANLVRILAALGGDVIPYQGNNPDMAETKHAGAILDAYHAFAEAGIGNPELEIRRSIGGKFSRRPVPAIVAEIPHLVRWARDIAGALRVPRTTWKRESRACPDLPGVAKVRRYRIAIAIDCSGSLSSLYATLINVARWAAKDMELEVILWADTAVPVRIGELVSPPHVGGGTQVIRALDLLNRSRLDAAIIVTDGHFGDKPQQSHLPACPVLWALCGSSTKEQLPLRPQDRVKVLNLT